MSKRTSIIILTYNNLNYTKDCIESIYRYTEKGSYEIIVVDNCSNDGTREWLSEQEGIKVILNEENLGFPRGCNQGIMVSEPDNDILLLNNDTIVTANWLTNLKICLESEEKIGAVGAVCGHDENLQGCNFSYDNFEIMQRLALDNNKSDASCWEEKAFLIGFCMLIKREVMDKLRNLDENYSPGYIEDNDFSLRIIELGYKLMLVHDCFIHHYLGTSFRKNLDKFYPILNKNRSYFKQKWGFETTVFDAVKNTSIKLIDCPKRILDLQSEIGVNFLRMRYLFPEAEIIGVEEDDRKRYFAEKFGMIYSSLGAVKERNFDYILIGNLLEVVDNPTEFINSLGEYLIDDGYVVGEIHNVGDIKNILSLMKDDWYFEHLVYKNSFTISDIRKLFREKGYEEIMIGSWYSVLEENEREMVKVLRQLIDKNYDITYYSFRFQKK